MKDMNGKELKVGDYVEYVGSIDPSMHAEITGIRSHEFAKGRANEVASIRWVVVSGNMEESIFHFSSRELRKLKLEELI